MPALNLSEQYVNIRKQTVQITSPLETEDYCIQPLPEISPPKWHLAHTTWFFEALILKKYFPNYQPFDASYNLLFNSYYNSLGVHKFQAERHIFSRPTVKEILSYRDYVDKKILELLQGRFLNEISDLITLGLNHEQQHQELLYMDIKGIYFSQVPYAVYDEKAESPKLKVISEKKYHAFSEQLVSIGHSGPGFCFDNEIPEHKYYLQPFKIRTTLVSNSEYLEFINADGYKNPEYWLSDGWDWVKNQSDKNPMYWVEKNKEWYEYDLNGLMPLNPHLPVRHVNFYEAAAFSRFANKRLPTEFEWEHAAASKHLEDGLGCLWQWTNSSYSPYPGHLWTRGPLGEYNSKFMVNQMVLRGGSAWTPKNHSRITYRNYFHPDKKWPFTGIRLAEDI
ncbi:MAG: ergothioneine biosynthesis protein EgtB [Bdellovibrio sp.]